MGSAGAPNVGSGPDTRRAISVSDLSVGMFLLDDLYDSNGRLLLGGGIEIISSSQIALAQESSMQIVTIDTAKGRDVEASDVTVPVTPPGSTGCAAPFDDEGEKVGFREEFPQAARVMQAAEEQAQGILEAARTGEKTDMTRVRDATRGVVESLSRNTKALPTLCHLYEFDEYTFKHSVSVCVLAASLAQDHGLDEEKKLEVGMAGLVHDIGKMQIPKGVLNKPGRLTRAEWEVMRQHPVLGAKLLQRSGSVSDGIIKALRQHHERADGKGYPSCIGEDSMLLYAKFIAIADAYDAMVSRRVYSKAKLPFQAVLEIFKGRGGQFAEDLAYQFIAMIGVYPIGSFVKTSQDELGIVSAHRAKATLHPKICVVFDEGRRKLKPGERYVDLIEAEPDDTGKRPRVLMGGDPDPCGVSPRDFLLAM